MTQTSVNVLQIVSIARTLLQPTYFDVACTTQNMRLRLEPRGNSDPAFTLGRATYPPTSTPNLYPEDIVMMKFNPA